MAFNTQMLKICDRIINEAFGSSWQLAFFKSSNGRLENSQYRFPLKTPEGETFTWTPLCKYGIYPEGFSPFGEAYLNTQSLLCIDPLLSHIPPASPLVSQGIFYQLAPVWKSIRHGQWLTARHRNPNWASAPGIEIPERFVIINPTLSLHAFICHKAKRQINSRVGSTQLTSTQEKNKKPNSITNPRLHKTCI